MNNDEKALQSIREQLIAKRSELSVLMAGLEKTAERIREVLQDTEKDLKSLVALSTTKLATSAIVDMGEILEDIRVMAEELDERYNFNADDAYDALSHLRNIR